MDRHLARSHILHRFGLYTGTCSESRSFVVSSIAISRSGGPITRFAGRTRFTADLVIEELVCRAGRYICWVATIFGGGTSYTSLRVGGLLTLGANLGRQGWIGTDKTCGTGGTGCCTGFGKGASITGSRCRSIRTLGT